MDGEFLDNRIVIFFKKSLLILFVEIQYLHIFLSLTSHDLFVILLYLNCMHKKLRETSYVILLGVFFIFINKFFLISSSIIMQNLYYFSNIKVFLQKNQYTKTNFLLTHPFFWIDPYFPENLNEVRNCK